MKLRYTSNTKMADLIHSDYRLIPIIGRFGIDYGFGNKTIGEVCKYYKINSWFFLEIINSYHNPEYFPKQELQHFTSEMIVQYLSNTHQYYLGVKLPEIQGYINEMQEELSEGNEYNVRLLNDFFKVYKKEFITHLHHEDSVVFPYVIALEEAVTTNSYNEEIISAVEQKVFKNYETNHVNLEVSLSDLKNLIMRHLPPVVCKELCQKLLMELFRLEEDIEDHSRIEEKVLVPKVRELEEQLNKSL